MGISTGYGAQILRGDGSGVDGIRASRTYGSGTSAITCTAVKSGATGNGISVIFKPAIGNNQPLSLLVSGNTITVNLATNGSGDPISTANQVIVAINANAASSRLITAKSGNSGGGGLAPFEWSPSDVPSLVDWYDATDVNSLTLSGSDVVSWGSKTSSGNTLTSGVIKPTYLGNRVVFNNAAQLTKSSISSANLTQNNFSIYAVAAHDLANTAYIFNITDGTAGPGAALRGVSPSDFFVYVDPTSFVAQAVPSVGYTPGQDMVLGLISSGAGANTLAGSYNGAMTEAIGTTTRFTGTTYVAGRTASSSLDSISEVVIVNSSDINLCRKLEGYLAWKRGLQAFLPSDHAFKYRQILNSADRGLTGGALATHVFSKLSGLKNFSHEGLTANVVDITAADSPDRTSQKQAGFINSGSITFEMIFDADDDSQALMESDFRTGIERVYRLRLSDPATTTMDFKGLVTNFGLSVPLEEAVSRSCTIELTGPVVRNYGV